MAKTKKNTVRLKKISDFDLETRLFTGYVLLEFSSITSESKSNLAELYEIISDLNKRAQSFEDERALDLAVKYDTEQVKSPEDVKSFIAAKKREGLYKMFGFMPIAHGDSENVLINQEGLIGTMLAQGNNQSFELAHKLITRELDDEDVHRLQEMIKQKAKTIREQLSIDLKTYQDMGVANSRIERYMPAMETLIYPAGRVEKLPFTVSRTAEGKIFRKKVRQNYNNKIKPDFLRLMGTAFHGGMMMAKHGSVIGKSSGSQYGKFLSLLQEQYGDAAEKVFDQAFNVKPEETREEAFNRKSEEMYAKMLAGLLVQKAKSLKDVQQHFDKTRVQEFLRVVDFNYVSKLEKGENDVFCLGFNSEVVDNSVGSYAQQMRQRREMIDDTAEDQIVSIHHKISVGSSEDLVKQLYPDNVDKIAKADEIVNHLANMCFVIGKKAHRELEPENEIVLSANPDSLVMAVEIDRKELQNIKDYLPLQVQNIIEKYVGFDRGKNEETLGISMPLPEPQNAVHKLRDNLKPQQKVTLKERLNLHLV